MLKAVLVAVLGCPLPCAAQAIPSAVSIKTELVLVRTGEIDTRSLTFTRIPTLPSAAQPAPQDEELLECAAGYPVVLLRRQLLQPSPPPLGVDAVFLPPVVSAQTDAPVTLTFDEAVPERFASDVTFAAPSTMPHVQRLLQVEGRLAFIPHVGQNKGITLSLSLPSGKNPLFRLPSIRSGATLLLRNFFPPQNGVVLNAPLLRSKWTLLIFVTPTLTADNK